MNSQIVAAILLMLAGGLMGAVFGFIAGVQYQHDRIRAEYARAFRGTPAAYGETPSTILAKYGA